MLANHANSYAIDRACRWAMVVVTSAIGMLCDSGDVRADEGQSTASQSVLQFEQDIRPVLVAKCIQCHGAKKQEGGLRLDSEASLLTGGDSGEALVAGKPMQSLLIEALKYESLEMPPSGRLSETTVAKFEKWIEAGAVWPQQTAALREDASAIAEDDRLWWAFQPLASPTPPGNEHDSGSHNAIDRFVLQKLVEHGLKPAPPADRAVLIRRLYFDLVGVPPSPQEVADFLADVAPDAWERVIDRLLQDERYGEHWARYWLDLVRYCESDGWNQDAYRPEAWRFRDYVVNAFNRDKPYPDFVLEQLAGDEMASDNPEHLVAAGFLRLGIYEYNQRDARGLWNDALNEITDVTSDVFLGMSMACCRCHDHKFDPLPQKDYFKLRAFFEPLIWRDDLVAATEHEKREYQQQLIKWDEATRSIRGQIEAIVAPYNERKWESTVDKFPLDIQACFRKPQSERTSFDEQMAYLVSRQFLDEGGGPFKSMKKDDKAKLDALETQLAAYDELRPVPLASVATVSDFRGPLSPTVIPDDPSQTAVEPGFLAVMSQQSWNAHQALGRRSVSPPSALVSTHPLASGTSGRRTQLAKWIGNPNNGLTTRVIVNRIWQQHFGEGLVATSSDFGRLGTLPSHPLLLDWLASEFIEQGWSFKWLHKQILMSATWQQSADHPQATQYQQIDPSERLLWRARVRRLQAEQIRDAMLTVSGELNADLGGPSIDETIPRRALYVKSFRNNLETFLHTFDMAPGLKSVSMRDSTTTPTQALLLFNGNYAIERATEMAARLQAGSSPASSDLASRDLASSDLAPRDLLQIACSEAWGRPPSDSELNRAIEFLGLSPGHEAQTLSPDRFIDFCHVLLNSNEFLYLR